MTRLYQGNGQGNGQGLLPAGNGFRRSGTTDARPRDASSPLDNWRHATPSERDPQHSPSFLVGHTDLAYQALLRSSTVKVSRVWVFFRLVRLLFFGLLFWVSVLWNRLSPMAVEERQKVDAKRFRDLLIFLGGVMIKVGQQLSQRPDVLPPAYCDELRTLLDDLPIKISKQDVQAAIYRQSRQAVDEIFAEFNYDPVGSASVSCVYWARLPEGDEVAVKVRRPGLLKAFTADLDAINWLFKLMEFLTIWRPGTTKDIRYELRDLLLEELDFRREARYQELFRRYHKRRKKLKVTAPKIYYKLSGEEVMVSEFVIGRKVSDIITALEKEDQAYLTAMRADGINPKTVAKHLVHSRYYSFHECPLFHGDPHPSNILVQPNNQVVMLDFGACGVFSQRDRNLMWQMNHYYSRDDVGGMVNMVLLLMEPIHPINIHPFKRDLLDAWWTGFYGIKSNHAQWWERSSLRLWLRFFELIRKYKIPIPRNMVRMIRATLLYDTVAARLYAKINVFKEFEKYTQDYARRARREIIKSATRQLLTGPDDSNFLKFREIADIGDDILVRLRRFLDNQDFTFAELPGKIYSALRAVARMLGIAAGMAMAGVLIGLFFKREIITDPTRTWTDVWNNSLLLRTIATTWLFLSVVLLFLYGRRIYLRFGDVDD
ncbi:MAG TPA: AarF/UbiB family protein [Pyrinomonadaceae bacterium]|jgi:predicted unusual protein kinase regulating ubiquinone biosynthesis (AarF/ABC1/UbiB family)|nr:AarF/UbiB family protein [Pyrinomonadaceae bacterium]